MTKLGSRPRRQRRSRRRRGRRRKRARRWRSKMMMSDNYESMCIIVSG